jgi:serine/threonine protein kinase
MGEVYHAQDTRLDRVVAIKVLPDRSSSPQIRERFEREERAISSLGHQHICALHDVGQQDAIDPLLWNSWKAETLAHRLKKGPLAPDQVLQACHSNYRRARHSA